MMRSHGQTYLYPTPSHGEQEIGVICIKRGEYPLYAVCYVTKQGSQHRIKTINLPVSEDSIGLGVKFNAWAGKRGLKEVTPC